MRIASRVWRNALSDSCLSLCLYMCFSIASGCNTEHSRDILLEWHNGQAVYTAIPFKLIQDSEEDFIPHGLKVTKFHQSEALEGEIHIAGNHVRFTPVQPFERGSNYAVYYHDKLVGEFNVPETAKR